MPQFKMPDGTYEEGANQAAASRTYNARRAGLTVRQTVPVTIEQMPVQQQITPTVEGPVQLQRANVVHFKQSVVPSPVQPVIAPLVIEPADNRVRPIRPPVRVLPKQPFRLPQPLQSI